MLYAIATVVALILDQWLKYWVTANIALKTGSIELIPGVFKLVNIHNEGAAFSILSGWRWIFVALAVVFAAVVIFAVAKNLIKGGLGRWSAILCMAGALGNCIDRVMYGYVVDMFVIEPVSFIQVFNIADLFITICGILFCVYIIIGGKEKKPAPAGHRHVEADEDEEEAERPRHQAKKPRPAAEVEAQPAPAPAPASRPAPVPAAAAPVTPPQPPKDEMDFTLDDIMNEFK